MWAHDNETHWFCPVKFQPGVAGLIEHCNGLKTQLKHKQADKSLRRRVRMRCPSLRFSEAPNQRLKCGAVFLRGRTQETGLSYCYSHIRVRVPGTYVLCMLARRHNKGYIELQTRVGNWALCTPCVQGSQQVGEYLLDGGNWP